jgi:1-deoxy-D-xylulose-5-phosphate reductoisomerase
VAVAAFLDEKLPFLGIAEVVEETLANADNSAAHDLDDLIAVNAEARRHAEGALSVA